MSIIGQPVSTGGSGSGGGGVFGNGKDGIANILSDTVLYGTDDGTAEGIQVDDTGYIVRQYKSLLIGANVTLSAGNRNCGMIFRVQGNVTIAGTIKNSLSSKTLLDSDGVDLTPYYPQSMITTLAGNGGAGGSSSYSGGAGQTGRFYGGGYSGGGSGHSAESEGGAGGSAANITTATPMFVGGWAGQGDWTDAGPGTYGGGGGGGGYDHSRDGNYAGGTGGSGPGGRGGDAWKHWNSQGTSYNYISGGSGGAGNIGGGVIIIYCGGNLTITGTINCQGGTGGEPGTGSSSYPGAKGGGAGGGRIYIVYKGNANVTGSTLNVNGGSGASTGGVGTSRVLDYETYKTEEM